MIDEERRCYEEKVHQMMCQIQEMKVKEESKVFSSSSCPDRDRDDITGK